MLLLCAVWLLFDDLLLIGRLTLPQETFLPAWLGLSRQVASRLEATRVLFADLLHRMFA